MLKNDDTCREIKAVDLITFIIKSVLQIQHYYLIRIEVQDLTPDLTAPLLINAKIASLFHFYSYLRWLIIQIPVGQICSVIPLFHHTVAVDLLFSNPVPF